MTYKVHKASYNLGDRLLKPEERIVVSTRAGTNEPIRFATHMGLSPDEPRRIISNRVWTDGEYLPTFLTKNCLNDPIFSRYLDNYNEGKKTVFGSGLKGKTVYIVHTTSIALSTQDIETRAKLIAHTAKYNGAEAVVLVAYTLSYDAQERGVWDTEHPRMQSDEAKFKFDGQSSTLEASIEQYLAAGVDTIVHAHDHSPEDTKEICRRVNEHYRPMSERASAEGSNKRYKIDFFEVDFAPMLGYYLSDFAESKLGFDVSDRGRNILLLNPDVGSKEFGERVHRFSNLPDAARASMDKVRAENGLDVKRLVLADSVGLTPERGIEGMDVLVMDDRIRSGTTMSLNISVLRGIDVKGFERDSKLVGKPRKVAVYTSRTNFQDGAADVLAPAFIDDIVIANADSRGLRRLGELANKTQIIYTNFMMAEACKAIEQGLNPSDVLTPEFIREKQLLKIDMPHGHRRMLEGRGSSII